MINSKKILDSLEDIIVTTTDNSTKRKIFQLTVECVRETPYIVCGKTKIPENLYYEAIYWMAKKSKIKCITVLRDGLGIGLKDAKDLSEEISIKEEIPFSGGFQKTDED